MYFSSVVLIFMIIIIVCFILSLATMHQPSFIWTGKLYYSMIYLYIYGGNCSNLMNRVPCLAVHNSCLFRKINKNFKWLFLVAADKLSGDLLPSANCSPINAYLYLTKFHFLSY